MGIEQGHADLKSSTLPYELIQKSAGFLNLEARGSKCCFGWIVYFYIFSLSCYICCCDHHWSGICKLKPPKILNCWRGLVRVTVIYMEYTRPRGQARVYRFNIHRKSLRPEEYVWKLWKFNVSSVNDQMKEFKCSDGKNTHLKTDWFYAASFFPFHLVFDN